MGCNCNKTHNISMGCCVPVLGPIENYYTKYQTDLRIEEEISGLTGSTGCCITPEEVDEKISAATDGMATEQWVETQGYITGVDLSDYAKLEDIPYSDIEAISGNVNTVSGDVITLSGEVASITASGMTSGQVQTMIDNSISGKVNVGDAVTSLDMSDSAWSDGKIQLLFFKGMNIYHKEILNVGDGLSIDSGRTISVTGGGITSGEVQTMIDNSISGKQDTLIAGDYITIDTANTISTSGLVTVVDNEVPAFSAENLVSYYDGFPSSTRSEYNYDTSKDYAIVPLINGNLYRNCIKIEVVDTGNTKTSGETSAIRASNATLSNVNPLPDYLTVESAGTRTFKYTPNEGYRISHVSNRNTYDGDPAGYSVVYVNGTPVTYAGGQSEDVIENTILPELAKKGNKVTAGDETITIIHDNTSGEDKIWVNTDYSISSYNSGSTRVPTTKAVYNVLQTKADTTYVNNNFMAKSQIWCGSEQEWSQISGSTTNGTIYLVY